MCIRDRARTDYERDGKMTAAVLRFISDAMASVNIPVSYTHLDVYKRQV